MRRRDLLSGAMAMSLIGATGAAAAPSGESPANDEIRRQLAGASGEGKKLFLLFYASWCGYCRLFDRFLADPAAAAILNREFRVVHMRALERTAQQKALQLDGADDVFNRFAKTPAQGLPFFVVLDGAGDPLATSVSPLDGRNIGFPTGKGDLDVFEKIIARAAPGITRGEIAVLRAAAQRQRGG